MNVFGWVLIGAVVLAAGVHVISSARFASIPEQVSRPLVPLLLAAFSLLLHAEATVAGRWTILAILLWGAADQAWHRRPVGRAAMVAGVTLDAAALLTVLLALHALPPQPSRWVGVVVVLLLGAAAGVRLRRSPRVGSRGQVAVTLYVALLFVVALLSWWWGQVVVGLGVMAQLLSVTVSGGERLSRSRASTVRVVSVAATHDAALVLVVLGLLRPDLLV